MPIINPYAPNPWAGCNIGIFGGSFNPPHEGHLMVGQTVRKQLSLDAIWWVISPQNPLKSTGQTADLSSRLAWCQELTRHDPTQIPTDLEAQITSPPYYTSKFLSPLMAYFPATNFVWVMGADNLHNIHRWQDWRTIFMTLPIAVIARPPHRHHIKKSRAGEVFSCARVSAGNHRNLARMKPPAWTFCATRPIDISSTQLRENHHSYKNG
jgi:nicotinate-nucleotide adenylyltransferase